MSVQNLESFASKYVQTFPLATLDNSVIGVDANYYMDQILNENHEEPLKVALSGTPFCFVARVEDDLQAAKDAGIKLVFVFDGLDYVNKTPSSADSSESRRAHEEGWALYMAGEPKETVSVLGKAGYPLHLVSELFRKTLSAHDVDFMVAPFSSLAFLSYLYRMDQGQPIDAIMASPDAFLFDVDKVVLSIDAREQKFSWLSRQDCLTAAGNPVPHVFRDAQLLLGSNFLPTFPSLQRATNTTIRDAVTLLSRGSVFHLCQQFRDDPAVASLDYADRYKKALMTIRHHVIITPDGAVQPMDIEHAPGDVHAFVGQRLPDELFFYISKGLLSPPVPNWLTTGEIRLSLPGGPIDCEPYRRFVIDQLNPLRLQSIKLLAESLHYYYQGREITLRSWDGRSNTQKIKELATLKEKAQTWKVKEIMWPNVEKSSRGSSVLSCLQMLKDDAFVPRSFSRGKPEYPMLTSQDEVISNVLWRFLHLRGFVDDKHQVTSWGRMLEAALLVMDGGSRKEEQGIIAVELLRMGLLNTQSVTGATVQSSDKAYEHKINTNLLSKIACLGRLKHEPVGYVGPLDRSLLTFAWEVTAMRQCLRDLCETILTTMLLNGDVSRERNDWCELSLKLPFINDNGSSLGIAVKSYLDAIKDHQTSSKTLNEFKEKVKSQESPYDWFAKVEDGTLHRSLDTAFKLFDAVNAAVRVGEKDVKDASTFAAAEKWLASRR